MRYMTLGMVALGLALGLGSSQAWSVDVDIEADVRVGGSNLSIGYFHDQLSPHGKWVEVARYGRVWQPAVVLTDENWRPYVNEGRWRYTDHGWYWDSSYEWGWAAFHYGRWNYDDQHKWVWLPDVVWGPAWVTWRRSDDVYGWAPLPFGSRYEGGSFVGVSLDLSADLYSFVPSRSFLSVNLGTVVLPRNRVGTVFNQTTVINNSYVYNDNRVINNGIPVEEVAASTKTEIKQEAIVDAKSPKEKGADGKIKAFRPAVEDGKSKSGAAKSEKDAPIPAQHVTKEKETDPKTKAPDAKAGEKSPAAKPGEKAPDAKAGERPPVAKPEEKSHDTKPSAKAPAAKADEKAHEGHMGKKTPDHKAGEKAPGNKAEKGPHDAKGDEAKGEDEDKEKGR